MSRNNTVPLALLNFVLQLIDNGSSVIHTAGALLCHPGRGFLLLCRKCRATAAKGSVAPSCTDKAVVENLLVTSHKDCPIPDQRAHMPPLPQAHSLKLSAWTYTLNAKP